MSNYKSFLNDFDLGEPVKSEERLRGWAQEAEAAGDVGVLAEIYAQIARCCGLQRRFEEGHALLAQAEALTPLTPQAVARIAIERGRLLRSNGKRDDAKPHFEDAFHKSVAAGDEYLALDAIHMIALVVPFEEALVCAEQGYAFAGASAHPRAVHWVAVLHNNLGWSYVEREDYAGALREFEAALVARHAEGADAETLRIAEYAIGLAWRNLGHVSEALELQTRIAMTCEAEGKPDRYFEKEVALCLSDLSRGEEARRWAQRALLDGSGLFDRAIATRLGEIAR